MTKAPPGRGHRTLPHPADVIVQAWGPTLAVCAEEVVAGLVGLCLDVDGADVVGRRPVRAVGDDAEAVLLDLLDEVVFELDAGPTVPVAARLQESPGGGLVGELLMADRGAVEATGAGPKGISRSGLRIDVDADRVTCHVLIDV